jgi:hypothetical protein
MRADTVTWDKTASAHYLSEAHLVYQAIVMLSDNHRAIFNYGAEKRAKKVDRQLFLENQSKRYAEWRHLRA